MDKLKIMEDAITGLICTNEHVVESLKKSLKQDFLDIRLSGMESCGCSFDDYNDEYNIELGLKYFTELYGFCLRVCLEWKLKILLPQIGFPNQSNNIELCRKIKYIEDNIKPLASRILDDSHFLKNRQESPIDFLTLLAFAYSVYHELGHVVCNKTTTIEFDREKKADEFAFIAMKSVGKSSNITNETRLLSIFIGISYMLLRRSHQEEIDDKDHPHSIERLYNLLDYWKIENESCFWKLAYYVVCEWCMQNKLSISSWEKETSITHKEKFMDAYLQFQKKL